MSNVLFNRLHSYIYLRYMGNGGTIPCILNLVVDTGNWSSAMANAFLEVGWIVPKPVSML
jgi:hypothetical protein